MPKAILLRKHKKGAHTSTSCCRKSTNIHLDAENYIKGEAPLVKSLSMFELGFEELRQGYKDGNVFVEEDWAFDINWLPSSWQDKATWCKYKIDAYVKKPDKSIVIDFKTGRYAVTRSRMKHNVPYMHVLHIFEIQL